MKHDTRQEGALNSEESSAWEGFLSMENEMKLTVDSLLDCKEKHSIDLKELTNAFDDSSC